MLTRSYNGSTIRQREDGFLALTDLDRAGAAIAAAEGIPAIRLENWIRRPSIEAFIAAFSRTVDPTVLPIQTERGAHVGGGITWAAPAIAHRFAIDISPAFALQVSQWVEEIRTRGYALDTRRPLDFAALVRDHKALPALALELVRVVEEQAAQLAEAAPKVESFDRLMRAEGDVGLQDLGRHLGRRPNLFINTLVADGYLFRDGNGTLLPTAYYRERGIFRVIFTTTTSGDGREHRREQTLVTMRGVEFFEKRYAKTDASGQTVRALAEVH